MLSDVDILAAVFRGEIRLDPWDPGLVQPASVDVRLGTRFSVFLPSKDPVKPVHAVDPYDPETMPHVDDLDIEEGQVAELLPGQFALATTLETIALGSGLSADVTGKSSLARLGLMVHVTAGFIDPGFQGEVTLELHNVAPHSIVLTPGMPIGQLCFFRLDTPAKYPYGSPKLNSKYQSQEGPTGSKYFKNRYPKA